MKYCESDIVSNWFRQIEQLQIVKHFPCTAWWAHRGRFDLCGCAIIVLGLMPASLRWYVCGRSFLLLCATVFSICCPRLSLRLHSLLTGMVSPPTYGSQCTPSLAYRGLIWVAVPFHAHLLSFELGSTPWDLRSIDEISIVNFIHFQVKTFSPVHTWILPGFRFVSRTCHEALSIILW